MNKFNKAIYFVAVSLLLAACGGGGSSDGSWSLSFNHNLINFADNSITPVSDIVSLSTFIH